MTKRTKQIHKLFGAKAMEKLWCAWCGKWGNHRSGNCPDKACATIEKMVRDCGRPIEFLDCVATDGAKSTTPTVKPKGKL